MQHKNLRVRESLYDRFEEKRFYLRFKDSVIKTQSEFIEMLLDFYVKNNYDKNWTENFRKEIRVRDNNTCVLCKNYSDKFNRDLSVHHIDGNKLNTTNKNCISLCDSYHRLVEKDIYSSQIMLRDILKKRYNYTYYKS